MFGMGPMELLLIGGLAVLLFGSKLPSVARSIGQSYREFRRGITEFQSEVDVRDAFSRNPGSRSSSRSRPTYEPDDYEPVSAPKFDPPPAAPEASQPAESREA